MLYCLILEVPIFLRKKTKLVSSFIMCITVTWIQVLGSTEVEKWTEVGRTEVSQFISVPGLLQSDFTNPLVIYLNELHLTQEQIL